eukprot:TRINITY_DN3637_c0_g1_i1.p1 TRINITY_DN3637_c0_g1~~TRINITY_DN3637_c0_g1_i1.p1  ORF type:complete len:176 (-),score=25.02 TRINITY_DN3637_c0_g1_i1:215-742(-)
MPDRIKFFGLSMASPVPACARFSLSRQHRQPKRAVRNLLALTLVVLLHTWGTGNSVTNDVQQDFISAQASRRPKQVQYFYDQVRLGDFEPTSRNFVARSAKASETSDDELIFQFSPEEDSQAPPQEKPSERFSGSTKGWLRIIGLGGVAFLFTICLLLISGGGVAPTWLVGERDF